MKHRQGIPVVGSIVLLFLIGTGASRADAVNILLTDADVQTAGCDLPDCRAGSFLVGQDFALGSQSGRPISPLQVRFGFPSPGQTVDLGGTLVAFGLGWTYQGVEYVTSNPSFLNFSVAPVVAPQPDSFNLLGRPIFLNSPMAMSGTLQGRNTVTSDLVDFNLTGFGIASGQFTLGINQFDEFRFGKWQLSRLTYDFQPIPEPSAWLLLASGLIAFVVVRKFLRIGFVSQTSERIMKHVILLVILFVSGTGSFAKADVLTLEAMTGSINVFQDMPFGTVSGPGFVFTVDPIGGSFAPITLQHLHPVPGQVIDQSSDIFVIVRNASIGGQVCCALQGTLDLSAIPSASFFPPLRGNSVLDVTAPFVVSGILTATRDPSLPPGPPFAVNYFFEGTGTITSEFRAASLCGSMPSTPCNFFWNESLFTFEPPTPPPIPEPSTWLLLASGCAVLLLSRTRLQLLKTSGMGDSLARRLLLPKRTHESF